MKAVLSLGIILVATTSLALADQGAEETLRIIKLENSQMDSITAAGKNDESVGIMASVTNINGKVTKDIKFIKDGEVIKNDVASIHKRIDNIRKDVAEIRADKFAQIKERLAEIRGLDLVHKLK